MIKRTTTLTSSSSSSSSAFSKLGLLLLFGIFTIFILFALWHHSGDPSSDPSSPEAPLSSPEAPPSSQEAPHLSQPPSPSTPRRELQLAGSVADDAWFTLLRSQLLASCGPTCDTAAGLRSSQEGLFMPQVAVRGVDCASLWAEPLFRTPSPHWPPPKEIPAVLTADYTLNGAVPTFPYYNAQRYSGQAAFSPVWTRQMIDDMVREAQEGTLAGTYGVSETNCFIAALRAAHGSALSVKGKHILVIGSERPWVEAALLAEGAQLVTTLEYGAIESQHPQVKTLTPERASALYLAGELAVDGVASFSSIEHSGLGRYGDLLNPWGDLIAVAQAWCVTRGEGPFYMATMMADEDRLAWNSHRMYAVGPSSLRFPLLMANWRQQRAGCGGQTTYTFSRIPPQDADFRPPQSQDSPLLQVLHSQLVQVQNSRQQSPPQPSQLQSSLEFQRSHKHSPDSLLGPHAMSSHRADLSGIQRLARLYAAEVDRRYPSLHRVAAGCPRVVLASSGGAGGGGHGHSTVALAVLISEALALNATLVVRASFFGYTSHGNHMQDYASFLNLAAPSRPLMLPDAEVDALVAGLARFDSLSRADTHKIFEERPCGAAVTLLHTGGSAPAGYCEKWCPVVTQHMLRSARAVLYPGFWQKHGTEALPELPCLTVALHVRLGDIHFRQADALYFTNVFALLLNTVRPRDLCLSLHVFASDPDVKEHYVSSSPPSCLSALADALPAELRSVVTFHLNCPPEHDLLLAITADVFVASESSFSFVPPLFSSPDSLLLMPPPKEAIHAHPTDPTWDGYLINPQTIFLSRTGELYDSAQAFDIPVILDAIYQRKLASQSKNRTDELNQ